MRTPDPTRRLTRATTPCRWLQRVVPRDAGRGGQRVLPRLRDAAATRREAALEVDVPPSKVRARAKRVAKADPATPELGGRFGQVELVRALPPVVDVWLVEVVRLIRSMDTACITERA